MRIIPPSFEILTDISQDAILRRLESAARVCYKSEDRMTDESAAPFIKRILKGGHESVIEHETISVRIICDRGVSHEWVRHRIASFSQESTRYCNYGKDKFGGELTFIRPIFWRDESRQYETWLGAMQQAERAYLALLKCGATAQEARSVLPHSIKTEFIVTMNLRQWRHFFRLRTDIAAHPQMREITVPLLDAFVQRMPVLFDDL